MKVRAPGQELALPSAGDDAVLLEDLGDMLHLRQGGGEGEAELSNSSVL